MAQCFGQSAQANTVLDPTFAYCPAHANQARANQAREFRDVFGLFGAVIHPCTEGRIRTFVDALHHFGVNVSRSGTERVILPVKPQRTLRKWVDHSRLVRFNIGLENLDSLKADLAGTLPPFNTASE